MAITLSVGADVVELDPDLFWADENNWHPVEQSAQRTLTGALIVSIARRIAGRPITLQPEDDSSAWMASADIELLKGWAAEPGQEMQLLLRGVERTVIFRHQDTALEALPVVHYRDVDGNDWYRPTLRFMEI
jgi:uncharacterized protein YbjT (DUF2867 family)